MSVAIFPISAMNENNFDSCKELVKGLHSCKGNVKAMNLRALLANTKLRENILADTQVSSWLDGDSCGLTEEEVLRLRATIMKAQDDSSCLDFNYSGEFRKIEIKENVLILCSTLSDKKKLLWLFTCDANLSMVKFINRLPGITDPVMKDGTTAFFIALGRQKWDFIQELLSHKREGDVRLARYALLEAKIKPEVKATIEAIIGTATPERPQTRMPCHE